jgi:HEAT repeat protein
MCREELHMRRLLCSLIAVALLVTWSPGRGPTSDSKQLEADIEQLKGAKIATEGSGLLSFLKSRTLSDEERGKAEVLIAQMGAMSFRTREQALQGLIEKGPGAIPLLKKHMSDSDLEIAHRCEKAIEKIQANDCPPEVLPAAVRVLADRKPAGAVECLLGYLPTGESEGTGDEVRNALTALAVQDGKPDKTLVTALKDKEPLRRAAAGEALTRAAAADTRQEVAALLKDSDPGVRWRVASALVLAKDKDAVPVLIQCLATATLSQAWQIDDILYRLADGKSPPTLAFGLDEAAHKKYRDAWSTWWSEHSKNVDIAILSQKPKLLGYTTIVLLDQNTVMELDATNNVLWRIGDAYFPLDVQVLPGDKVLIAEYGDQNKAGRVTERNFRGEVLWQHPFDGPQVAQRLPNGNTFIAGKYHMMEVGPGGKKVWEYTVPDAVGIMKCSKVSTGEIIALFDDARVVRLDATGKELASFTIKDLDRRLFGGRIQALPNGHVLIPHHGENKVVEYDANGRVVWKVEVGQPIVATRLPNGNTIVTSMAQNRAVEFDRDGKEVWQYRSNTRVTRALRR